MDNPILDILSGIGTVMDTPARLVRSSITGDWNNATGTDVLKKLGLGNKNSLGGFGGIGAELALDPLNLIGGLGLANKAYKAIGAGGRTAEGLNAARGLGWGNAGKLASGFEEDLTKAMAHHGRMLPEGTAASELDALLHHDPTPMHSMTLDQFKNMRSGNTVEDMLLGKPILKNLQLPQMVKGFEINNPETLQLAWDKFATRMPEAYSKVGSIGQIPHQEVLGAYHPGSESLWYSAKGLAREQPAIDSTMMHELIHANQNADPIISQALREGPKTRDIYDAAMIEAEPYYKQRQLGIGHGLDKALTAQNQIGDRNSMLALLGGYNIGAHGLSQGERLKQKPMNQQYMEQYPDDAKY